MHTWCMPTTRKACFKTIVQYLQQRVAIQSDFYIILKMLVVKIQLRVACTFDLDLLKCPSQT